MILEPFDIFGSLWCRFLCAALIVAVCDGCEVETKSPFDRDRIDVIGEFLDRDLSPARPAEATAFPPPFNQSTARWCALWHDGPPDIESNAERILDWRAKNNRKIRTIYGYVRLIGAGDDWCEITPGGNSRARIMCFVQNGSLSTIRHGEPVSVVGRVFTIFNDGPGMDDCIVRETR